MCNVNTHIHAYDPINASIGDVSTEAFPEKGCHYHLLSPRHSTTNSELAIISGANQ